MSEAGSDTKESNLVLALALVLPNANYHYFPALDARRAPSSKHLSTESINLSELAPVVVVGILGCEREKLFVCLAPNEVNLT